MDVDLGHPTPDGLSPPACHQHQEGVSKTLPFIILTSFLPLTRKKGMLSLASLIPLIHLYLRPHFRCRCNFLPILVFTRSY